MKELVDIAEFTSERFAPILPDECQVNPGVFGAELAFWLCTQLAASGVVTSYPQHEDWGWYLEYSSESGAEFAVHCGNVSGEQHRWRLSLRPFGRKLFGRDKPSSTEASRLIGAIRSASVPSPPLPICSGASLVSTPPNKPLQLTAASFSCAAAVLGARRGSIARGRS